MTRRTKKTKTVTNNEKSYKTAVKKINKSNINHLKEISKSYIMKDASAYQLESKKSKKKNTTDTRGTKSKKKTVTEEELGGTSKTIVETSSNLPADTNNNESIPSESAIFKGSAKRKHKGVTINETPNIRYFDLYSHDKEISNSIDMKDTPSTSSKMKTGGTEGEPGTAETTVAISYNLPDKDKNKSILTDSLRLEYENNMNNCYVLLEDINKSHNTKMKTVESEEKQGTEMSETSIDYSFNLPDKKEEIPAECAFSKSLKHRATKMFTIKEIQNIIQSNSKCHDKDISNSIDMKDTPSTSSKMKTVGPGEEQNTAETIVENFSNLLDTDNNESILNKGFNLEVGDCGPSCFVHAYYQDPSNSDCQYKRKLSEVFNDIQNFLKRSKPS